MEQEEKKNNITVKILIALIILLIAGLGITIAYFSSRSESGIKTVKTGVFEISYKDGNSLPLTNAVPIDDSEMQEKASKISFSAENESAITGYMDITLEDIEMSSELKNLEFKWALYETDSNYTNATIKVNNGNFRNVGEDNKQLIGKNIKIDKGTTKYYNLYIWIRETNLNQDELMNKNFSGKIVIKGNQKEGQKLLSQKIKDNNSPIKTNTPSFSSTATTDEGLIKGEDEDGETYYFRGAVNDNYVKIGDLKWAVADESYHKAGDDMLWRIVRINGDGTIRLIADGSVGKSKFNSTNTDKKYVGYTYDNPTPNNPDGGKDSTIKTYLETWYNGNMTNYDKYIANTRYCNDTTYRIDGSYTRYGAYDRLYTHKEPSFECENTTEDYGGEYDLKVGLITADEAAFAGGVYNTSNTSYYLLGKNSGYFWTASPNYFYGYKAYVWNVYYYGYLDYNYVSYEFAVRPAVNLRADLLYTGGSGKQDDPYVVAD